MGIKYTTLLDNKSNPILPVTKAEKISDTITGNVDNTVKLLFKTTDIVNREDDIDPLENAVEE